MSTWQQAGSTSIFTGHSWIWTCLRMQHDLHQIYKTVLNWCSKKIVNLVGINYPKFTDLVPRNLSMTNQIKKNLIRPNKDCSCSHCHKLNWTDLENPLPASGLPAENATSSCCTVLPPYWNCLSCSDCFTYRRLVSYSSDRAVRAVTFGKCRNNQWCIWDTAARGMLLWNI